MVAPDLPNTNNSQCNRPQYWTKARLELVGWLQEHASALADLYKGAVELTYSRRVPGWTRFVCHVMREIGNRLPDIIVGPAARTKTDADHSMSDLAGAWIDAGYPKDGTLPGSVFVGDSELPADTTIPVSHRVLQITSAMVRDYVVGCESRRDSADVLFQALTPTREDDRAKLRSLADEWHKIMRWAVRGAHVSTDGSNEVDSDACQERFDVFQTILGSLVWDFFTTAGEIDEILEDANA